MRDPRFTAASIMLAVLLALGAMLPNAVTADDDVPTRTDLTDSRAGDAQAETEESTESDEDVKGESEEGPADAEAASEDESAEASEEETPDPDEAAAMPLGDRSERMRAIVTQLSSDEFEGRRVGTPGCELAMEYLEGLMSEIGMEPVPDARGLRHGFSLTQGIKVEGTPSLRIGSSSLSYGTDFTVASFSGSGSASNAGMVFAGYGIRAPELDWNDYEGLDVTDKVVVILRGEPQENDENSRFAGTQPTLHSDLRRKAALARDLGAAAMIVLNNQLMDAGAPLPEIERSYSAVNFDIPVAFARSSFISSLTQASIDSNVRQLQQAMDEFYMSISFHIDGGQASINISVEKDLATGQNLIGIVPGSNAWLSHSYVVIGAHYDHLGHGGPESRLPERIGEIHHGADDNASGVAAVLEIARYAKENPEEFPRSLMVVLFSGEEVGLLGSAAMMRQQVVDPYRFRAMLNFDMVGRLRDDTLTLGSAGSSPQFEEMLEGLPEEFGLNLKEDNTGFGGSDHMSFLRSDVPSLFFFTGVHDDYHTPDDTADKVNFEGLERITEMGARVASELSLFDGKIEFEQPAGLAEAPTRNRANLSVSMGTIPSYEDHEEPGFHISDVRPGAPADKAGIKGGDIVVRMIDRKIANIYDFIYVLQDCEPGQQIAVRVIRDGEELDLTVTLEARNVER